MTSSEGIAGSAAALRVARRAALKTLSTQALLLALGAEAGSPASDADANTRIRTRLKTPHPALARLADGEALDLGRYACDERAPGVRCEKIFDYSRINYDPHQHRMLAFGGGHAATGRTDVDVFDLSTLKWQSLYASMRCDAIAAGDIDPRGFHRATGHPVARHSYDQNVVAQFAGRPWLLLFSTEGFSGHCHSYNATIKSVAALPLDTDNPSWTFGPEAPMPWGYGGPAEFDPVSGMVILLGGQSSGLWVYDPGNRRIVAAVRGIPRPANSSNLVYHARTDRMLLLDRADGGVHALVLDRADWQRTRQIAVEVSGQSPAGLRNLALDTRNDVMGGIHEGRFLALDLRDWQWRSHAVTQTSAGSDRLTNVRHHAIDYDPVNNVFILVTGKGRGLRTWAYRFGHGKR